jgi:hypothetical protein
MSQLQTVFAMQTRGTISESHVCLTCCLYMVCLPAETHRGYWECNNLYHFYLKNYNTKTNCVTGLVWMMPEKVEN